MRIKPFLFKAIVCLSFVVELVKSDPDPLQDYCVADTKNTKNLFLNGVECINPELAVASNFATSTLAKPGNTKNTFGFNVTATNVAVLPGVNTQGLTASEVTIVLKGALLVGFVDTSNRLFTQQLRAGDSFVFPKALIHFLFNMDTMKPALALSGLSSQNPGAQLTSLATFASKPPVPDEVLKKAFQINGIVGAPQIIQGTRFLLIEPRPWLPFPAPMQQAHRAGVEAPARASHVVAAEAVLVPPVIDRLDFPAKNQQKWRERAQLVHAPLLLDLHPRLDLLPVIPAPPFPEVHHHHAGVEVAGVPGPEYPRENRVGPELFGEVFGEIGVAVFRGPDDPGVS
nr:germin-like protein subfamily 1 member 1 [Ipomoea batatas]